MKHRVLIAAVLGPLLLAGSFDILARDSRKEPITEKHYSSKTFFNLQRITRLGALDVQVLYAISGAKDFKEFAVATVTARFLKLDRGLVLGALHDKKLDEILKDFEIEKNQGKRAIKAAKKELDRGEEWWKKQ